MKSVTRMTMRTTTGLMVLSALVACAASGCSKPCTDGTFLLDVTLEGTVPSGTQVSVTATYLMATFTTSFPMNAGQGMVEIEFPPGSAYQPNQRLDLIAKAMAGSVEIARGSGAYQLSGTCHADRLILSAGDMAISVEDAGQDLGGLDLAGSDLAVADLADMTSPPDLSPPLDMTFVPSQVPSCVGLAETCGPTGTDNCCQSPVVTGGSFGMGYDKAIDNAYPSPGTPAMVSDFRLDKYEITVGRFRQFVAAGKGTQTSGSPPASGAGSRTLNGTANQGGWDATNWNANLKADTGALKTALNCDSTYATWKDTATATSESLPINCISWYDAMAFCIWDGGFLPTEAEWHYAASGGNDQRAYPWSNTAGSTTIDCSYANYKIDSPAGTYCVNGTTGGVNRVGSESIKGDGKYGQSDLAGNVNEWVLDWYPSSGGYPINPCNNCASLAMASYRVVRGGSFLYGASYLRVAYRFYFTPSFRIGSVWALCARTK